MGRIGVGLDIAIDYCRTALVRKPYMHMPTSGEQAGLFAE
jgi:hypothetical protein